MPETLTAISYVRSGARSLPTLINAGFGIRRCSVHPRLLPHRGSLSRDFINTKRLMYSEPDMWDNLMTRLSVLTAAYLRAQIASGAAAVQVFDSWAGVLSKDDYMALCSPLHSQDNRSHCQRRCAGD